MPVRRFTITHTMPNANPLVTIVVSCYNHSMYVEEALNSVINQNYKSIQLLIIDDCSTDNSCEIIEKWITKHKIGTLQKNANNLGITKSFNNAFKFIQGEYFIDLAADDVLLPNCVEKQIDVYKNYPNSAIGIVYGNTRVIDKDNNYVYTYYEKFPQNKKTIKPTDGFIYKELLNHSNIICSVSALMNKKIFQELGGYDESLIYEDYDLWIRMARKYSILYLDDIIVEKRKLISSLGQTNALKLNKRTRLFKHSTYLIVKKTFKMNRTKLEDNASMKKISIELKGNLKALNFLLILKYLILILKFKFRTFKAA